MSVALSATRRLLTVWAGVTMLFALGLTGCGNGLADDVAVKIDGTSIGNAAVAHWMSVIAGEVSTEPGVPEPEVPAPPRYAQCIAYHRAFPFRSAAGQVTQATIEHECAIEFQKERLKALYLLVSYTWVSGEAKALGVHVSNYELQQRIALLKGQFPDEAGLRKFLVGERGTLADLLVRLRLSALAAAVQQKLEREGSRHGLTASQRQTALDRFSSRFVASWTGRTDCRAGYVVPLCMQYKPPRVVPELVPPSIPLTKMTVE